jgi:hypothetical protein
LEEEEERIMNHLAPNLPPKITQGLVFQMLGANLRLMMALMILRKPRKMKTQKSQAGLLTHGVSQVVKNRKKMIIMKVKNSMITDSTKCHQTNRNMKKN